VKTVGSEMIILIHLAKCIHGRHPSAKSELSEIAADRSPLHLNVPEVSHQRKPSAMNRLCLDPGGGSECAGELGDRLRSALIYRFTMAEDGAPEVESR